ncbi:helix-turn-helix transcriptional regulator [Solwaraspora sp. WMMB335]|uniref:helix-turn-helix transcriptional regulator n=1 Tax=Solwaraspora sp. WMMB335 TaxID=3404118 RepID=UPI003B94ADAE
MNLELVGAAEIGHMLGVSRQRVHVITRSKGFPEPVAELVMGSVWLKADVERWIQENRPPRAS